MRELDKPEPLPCAISLNIEQPIYGLTRYQVELGSALSREVTLRTRRGFVRPSPHPQTPPKVRRPQVQLGNEVKKRSTHFPCKGVIHHREKK